MESIDTGNGIIEPVNSVTIVKGRDNDGDLVYAIALSEGTDLVDALALLHYGVLDVSKRVESTVTSD